eukprot:GDKJ01021695.1.p1 GENE.GDKJ01021695.1~~GDKJ01021695.1.p1  ORF type:complete len:166 (+),score=39.14 GDKJ01021695.1:27-500(+)
MIKSFLLINNAGKARISRFYDDTPFEKQKEILKQVHRIISQRPAEFSCSFYEDPAVFGEGCRMAYKSFGNVTFVIIFDDGENELGMVDIIQVIAHVLDKAFPKVSEHHIVFNLDKANFVIDEIIVGGMVVETAAEAAMENIDMIKKEEDKENAGFGF